MTTAIWQPEYNVKVSGKLKKRFKKQHKKSPKAEFKASLSDLQQSLLPPNLPTSSADWLLTAPDSVSNHSSKNTGKENHSKLAKPAEHLTQLIQEQNWQWPSSPIVYITDPHADAEALLHSIVSSGGVVRTGPSLQDFKLTRFGKSAHFVIGGDCFDKGPSNLQLLDFMQLLEEKGAKLSILAGNHDLRVIFGMQQAGKHCSRNSHFFVRMGTKCIPLIQELIERHKLHDRLPKNTPDLETCRKALLPTEQWFKRFPVEAKWVMPEDKIDKEVKKVREKIRDFTKHCDAIDLDLRLVYAAVLKFQQEFLTKNGAYHWFYKKLQLAMQEGSFLFLHAGVDDRFSSQLGNIGIKKLNKRFRMELEDNTPFELYYGSFFNTVRTKYRSGDLPFTEEGAANLRESGVLAIVQGHINKTEGQSIQIRENIIHLECDITLDRNSRIKEGLNTHGAGCTLLLPSQKIVGISTDWHQAKLLDMTPQAIH